MVSGFTDFPELKAITMAGENPAKNVCTCVNFSLRADAKLAAKLDLPRSEVQRLFETDKFKTYISARFFQTILSCTAEELGQMLASSGAIN